LRCGWGFIQCDYAARVVLLTSMTRAAGAPSPVSYLGTRPSQLWRPVAAGPARAAFGDRVQSVFETAELAIDMRTFREVPRAAVLASPLIQTCFGCEVQSVLRTPAGYRVQGVTSTGASWTRDADLVVNCLWEGRLAIDAQMGLLPRRPWVYRLKCRLMGRLPGRLEALPSLTLMCGPFGDIVNYANREAYLSWYPACLLGWSADVTVPAAWEQMSRGKVRPEEVRAIIDASQDAFEHIAPGLRDTVIESVAGGVIFSWGETDIDDLASELHRRDDIGPAWHDGYITVNTGKLTSAPLFAQRIVDMLGAA
jgi:hypothetical protein